jgi:hypothetical protein
VGPGTNAKVVVVLRDGGTKPEIVVDDPAGEPPPRAMERVRSTPAEVRRNCLLVSSPNVLKP